MLLETSRLLFILVLLFLFLFLFSRYIIIIIILSMPSFFSISFLFLFLVSPTAHASYIFRLLLSPLPLPAACLLSSFSHIVFIHSPSRLPFFLHPLHLSFPLLFGLFGYLLTFSALPFSQHYLPLTPFHFRFSFILLLFFDFFFRLPYSSSLFLHFLISTPTVPFPFS